ncbi:MAG TPA: phosphohistidine phosphatase SixA [Bacteroidetes bacterium]|nr:phosphohistidine phosphatase SixA [Bacteroidota bacterium]
MILFFLRHGEAGMNFPSDFERELTDGGIGASHSIGGFCKKTGITFTHIISSPLMRAKQTAQVIVQKFPGMTMEESELLTPNADPKNLFNFLRSFTSSSKILLVTHEPFVSNFISTLISGTETVNIIMRPTTFACVETTGSPARGNGKLLWLVPSELIQQIV